MERMVAFQGRLELISLDFDPDFPVVFVVEPRAFGKQIPYGASGYCSASADLPPSVQVPDHTSS